MEANQQEKKMATIDAFLSQFAKTLKPGESISIPLYKGASSITNIDPNQAHKATKAAATIGAKAPAQSVLKRNEITFPRILKFIETVEKPNFQKPGEFADGRLYMEDIPKAKVRYHNNITFIVLAIHKIYSPCCIPILYTHNSPL